MPLRREKGIDRTMTYTLVIVVHKPDYPLRRLQARSLARYLSPVFTDEICRVGFCVTSVRGPRVRATTRRCRV
jgi:hypothetical protein